MMKGFRNVHPHPNYIEFIRTANTIITISYPYELQLLSIIAHTLRMCRTGVVLKWVFQF